MYLYIFTIFKLLHKTKIQKKTRTLIGKEKNKTKWGSDRGEKKRKACSNRRKQGRLGVWGGEGVGRLGCWVGRDGHFCLLKICILGLNFNGFVKSGKNSIFLKKGKTVNSIVHVENLKNF